MTGPFYDGHVHVLKRQCQTCIYRRGNPMTLTAGRRAQMQADAVADDTVIICHCTLPGVPGAGRPAVCRGFHVRCWRDTLPLRLAVALGRIRQVPAPAAEEEQQ